jgi:hypothetical protein
MNLFRHVTDHLQHALSSTQVGMDVDLHFCPMLSAYLEYDQHTTSLPLLGLRRHCTAACQSARTVHSGRVMAEYPLHAQRL